MIGESLVVRRTHIYAREVESVRWRSRVSPLAMLEAERVASDAGAGLSFSRVDVFKYKQILISRDRSHTGEQANARDRQSERGSWGSVGLWGAVTGSC